MHTNRQVLLQLAVCVAVGLVLSAAGAIGDEVTISGKVLTPDGQPAAGAKVFCMLHSPDGPVWPVLIETDAMTGASGAFTLCLEGRGKPEPMQQLVILALADGYGLGWTLAPLTEAFGLTITAHTLDRVTGMVVDEAGHPVPGASVRAADLCPEGEAYWLPLGDHLGAITDQTGRFELSGLPAGVAVRLEAMADGYQRIESPPQPVRHLVGTTLMLRPATAVSGRITRDGEPVQGMCVVVILEQTGEAVGTVMSGEDGTYRVTGIAPGTYAVNLCWRGSAEKLADRTAATQRGVRCDLDVPATDIDFGLVCGGYITGHVVDSGAGEAIAEADVSAYVLTVDYPHGGVGPVRTSSEGAYRLHVPAGTYELWAEARGYTYEGPDPTLRRVTVETGRTIEGFDIALTRQARIRGSVVDVGGNPLGGAVLRDVRGYGPPTITPTDGQFNIPVRHNRLPTELCAVHTERGLIGRLILSEPTSDARIVLTPGATATGQVVDVTGIGLAGVSVTAQYSALADADRTPTRARLPTARTDLNGRFHLPWLPHGVAVTVYLGGEDGCFVSERRWATSITLSEGETVRLGPTVLDRSGQRLVGRVMDAEHRPAPGCVVIDLGVRRRAVTDEAGRFELTGLPILRERDAIGRPYRPSILVVDPGRGHFCGVSDIDPRRVGELELVLGPPGSACGRVVTVDGGPCPGLDVGLRVDRVGLWQWPEALAGYRWGAILTAEGETGVDGVWQFTGLVPGLRYSVYVTDVAGVTHCHGRFLPIAGVTVDLGGLRGDGAD